MTRFLIWLDNTRFVQWLDRAFFHSKSIDQACAEIVEDSRREVAQTEKTIQGQLFLQHLAKRRIEAVREWQAMHPARGVERCEDEGCPHYHIKDHYHVKESANV